MVHKGPLGFKRLLGVGPLTSQELSVSQGSLPQREEFIEMCKESENAEEWARGYTQGVLGEDLAERMPEEQLEDMSESYCEGLADLFGL